ncbi:hypothetical protein DFH06DRAFT_216577 [Mycena polygramma]|nr:hypothetical protein DFH06DRAFT_216577 [Mycena polygramma]
MSPSLSHPAAPAKPQSPTQGALRFLPRDILLFVAESCRTSVSSYDNITRTAGRVIDLPSCSHSRFELPPVLPLSSSAKAPADTLLLLQDRHCQRRAPPPYPRPSDAAGWITAERPQRACAAPRRIRSRHLHDRRRHPPRAHSWGTWSLSWRTDRAGRTGRTCGRTPTTPAARTRPRPHRRCLRCQKTTTNTPPLAPLIWLCARVRARLPDTFR